MISKQQSQYIANFIEKLRLKMQKNSKFPTKADLDNGYLKEHFKDNGPEVFEIKKNQNYIILAPSNIHCFNKIMNDCPEDIIKKDQLEVFEKDIIPIFCVNKIPQNMEIEAVK